MADMFSNGNASNCPVARIAEEAQRLVDLLELVEELDTKKADEAGGAITKKLGACVEWASFQQAKSAKGALFQVFAIADLTTALLGADANKYGEAIRRLAHSVASYLEDSNEGLDRRQAAGEYYLSGGDDPFRAIESVAITMAAKEAA
jgi:hypothetical protein